MQLNLAVNPLVQLTLSYQLDPSDRDSLERLT